MHSLRALTFLSTLNIFLSQSEIDLSVENDQDLFVKGFVLGAQMMLEILTADPMEDVVR